MKIVTPVRCKFNPDQPRDGHGRWGEGGSPSTDITRGFGKAEISGKTATQEVLDLILKSVDGVPGLRDYLVTHPLAQLQLVGGGSPNLKYLLDNVRGIYYNQGSPKVPPGSLFVRQHTSQMVAHIPGHPLGEPLYHVSMLTEDKDQATLRTFTHELGHHLRDTLPPEALSKLDTLYHEAHSGVNKEGFVSAYAKVNPSEYMSENFSAAVHESARYKANYPQAHAALKEALAGSGIHIKSLVTLQYQKSTSHASESPDPDWDLLSKLSAEAAALSVHGKLSQSEFNRLIDEAIGACRGEPQFIEAVACLAAPDVVAAYSEVGKGFKYSDDQPRDDHGRFGSGGSARTVAKPGAVPKPKPNNVTNTGITLKPATSRAFNGKEAPLRTQFNKLQTGELGEKIVTTYLQSMGLHDARTLNIGKNNFPVDLIQDHGAIEVKAGLSSNGKTAQHWRATQGQPGEKTRQWLKSASKEAKAKFNQVQQQKCIDRKNAAVKQLSQKLGHTVKASTIATIINPDTKTADLYRFNGFHSRIAWNSDQAKKAYVGSFRYANAKGEFFTILLKALLPSEDFQDDELDSLDVSGVPDSAIPDEVTAEDDAAIEEYVNAWESELESEMAESKGLMEFLQAWAIVDWENENGREWEE